MMKNLSAKHRRLDRLNREAPKVIAAMRQGAALHLTFCPARQWVLSTGVRVADEVARFVITRPDVAGVGDALFAEAPAQTWRWNPRGERPHD
jgi:hypothetical protein